MIDQWLDIIRREAQHVVELSEKKSTLVATGYNPKTHSVKGILVPSGVETGWVPIATNGIGNGWGMVIGPKVGDAEKLDGDQFDVEFEFGDPNTPVARHRVFSNPDSPPVVESGEILIRHEGAARMFFDKNKNLNVYGSKSDSQHVILGSDGSVEIKEDGGAFIKLSGNTIELHAQTIKNTGVTQVLLEDNAVDAVEGGNKLSTKVFVKATAVAPPD